MGFPVAELDTARSRIHISQEASSQAAIPGLNPMDRDAVKWLDRNNMFFIVLARKCESPRDLYGFW